MTTLGSRMRVQEHTSIAPNSRILATATLSLIGHRIRALEVPICSSECGFSRSGTVLRELESMALVEKVEDIN